ncbi:MAG: outer membrane beta-barrel domain-containing protein [Bdellovibrionales bacterium]
MKTLLAILLIFCVQTFAADLTKEMDALGANKDLMRKARAIDPKNRVRVVQNREVERRFRLEVGVNGSLVTGGDPYVNTNLLGGHVDFHVTPRWSVGARYYNASNSLNREGDKVFADAESRRAAGESGFRQPGIDWAKESWLGVVNFYPIYGKMNLFDMGISQFDVYILAGAGQINLASSGTTPLYTAGGGVGLWLAQHVSTRLEARWQGYQDQIFDGFETHKRSIDQTLLSVTLGILL